MVILPDLDVEGDGTKDCGDVDGEGDRLRFRVDEGVDELLPSAGGSAGKR